MTAALFGGAGVLQLTAAAIRWTPCLAPAASTPEASTASPTPDPCALAEDHLRDYLVVSTPFEPIPGAVVLAGIASLLLVAVWTIWAVGFRRHPVVVVSAGIAAVAWLFTAVTQLLGAASDGVLGVLDYGIVVVLMPALATVASLVAALRLAVITVTRASSDRLARGWLAGGWILVAAASVLAFPLVDYVLLNPISGSHDSPIGSGAPAAIVFVMAGLAFTVAAALRHGLPPSAAPGGRGG